MELVFLIVLNSEKDMASKHIQTPLVVFKVCNISYMHLGRSFGSTSFELDKGFCCAADLKLDVMFLFFKIQVWLCGGRWGSTKYTI